MWRKERFKSDVESATGYLGTLNHAQKPAWPSKKKKLKRANMMLGREKQSAKTAACYPKRELS